MKDRVILHSDINNCYASIECLHRPAIRNKPVAVCGDPEARRAPARLPSRSPAH